MQLLVHAQPVQTCADIFNLRQYWNSSATASPSPTLYTLENTPVVSFIAPAPDGYQVYIQDISGGLTLLLPDTIQPFLNIGDQLTNIEGYLTLANGSLAMIPVLSPQIVSSDNPIYPQDIDIMTMMMNPDNYESALVKLNNITANGGGDLFQPGRHYIIYQQQATSAIFTQFPLANYIGTPIPEAPFNLTGLVTFNRFTSEITITPRFFSDITYSYGNNRKGSWEADDISVSDGYLQIRSLTRQPLQVYTLLGQIIIDQWVEPGFSEIAMPNSGVYIVKLGQLTKRVCIP